MVDEAWDMGQTYGVGALGLDRSSVFKSLSSVYNHLILSLMSAQFFLMSTNA